MERNAPNLSDADLVHLGENTKLASFYWVWSVLLCRLVIHLRCTENATNFYCWIWSSESIFLQHAFKCNQKGKNPKTKQFLLQFSFSRSSRHKFGSLPFKNSHFKKLSSKKNSSKKLSSKKNSHIKKLSTKKNSHLKKLLSKRPTANNHKLWGPKCFMIFSAWPKNLFKVFSCTQYYSGIISCVTINQMGAAASAKGTLEAWN